MIMEFQILVGNKKLSEVEERWASVCQEILQLSDATPSQEQQWEVIQVLDSKFRPPGIHSKGFPLFKTYEVSNF